MSQRPDPTLSSAARAALRGLPDAVETHLPGDPGYLEATRPWNFAITQRPAAVVLPQYVDEVQAAVRAAASAGLSVAVQSTGHNPTPLAAHGLHDALLVRMSRFTGVTVDPDRRTARVLGGTLARDVVEAAGKHGLALLHGSSPDVAVAGYATGGGFSWYARRHGIAANSVVAVELVTADGRLVRADGDTHPDLFWAVRGGGGNVGVVTALELALHDIPTVYGGMLLWDAERAPEVAHAWSRWTRTAPETATTSLRVMSFPPLPELPAFLSGRHVVVVDGAVLEDDGEAARVVAPLAALGPEIDTWSRMAAPALLDLHMDPPGPTPAVGDGRALETFDEAAVDALLGVVGPGTSSPLLFAEVRHLGGAVARPAPGGGVLSHVPEPYLLYGAAVTPTPEAAAAGLGAVRELRAAMAPWSGRSVLNFAEQPADVMGAFPADVRDRLRAVRRVWDPDGRMLANHRIDD